MKCTPDESAPRSSEADLFVTHFAVIFSLHDGRRRGQGHLIPDVRQREHNVSGGGHQGRLGPDVGQRGMPRPGRWTSGHQVRGTPCPGRQTRGGRLGLGGPQRERTWPGRRPADGWEALNIYIILSVWGQEIYFHSIFFFMPCLACY